MPVKCIWLRTEDLAERAAYANSHRANLFLSIHVNAGGGTGFESYTYLTTGVETKETQTVIHNAVMGYMQKFNMPDRGQKATNFQVLRETAMPAVLLECLFIDRQEDAKLLKSPVFLDGLANEVAYGVVQALGLQKVSVDDPKPDPCANCQRISDLIIENTKLHDENMRTKQLIKEVKILLNNI